MVSPHDLDSYEGRAFDEESRQASRAALINSTLLVLWLVACFVFAAIEGGAR